MSPFSSGITNDTHLGVISCLRIIKLLLYTLAYKSLKLLIYSLKPSASFLGPVTSRAPDPQDSCAIDLIMRLIVLRRIQCPATEQKKPTFKQQLPLKPSKVDKKVVQGRRTPLKPSSMTSAISTQQPPQTYTTEYLNRSALQALGINLSQISSTVFPMCLAMKFLLSVPLKNRQLYQGFFSRMLDTAYFIFQGIISFQLVWKMLQGICCSLPTVLFLTYFSNIVRVPFDC